MQLVFARTRPGALVQASAHLPALVDNAPRRAVPTGRHYRSLATSSVGVSMLWTGDFGAAETTLAATETRSRELGLELIAVKCRGVPRAARRVPRAAAERAPVGIPGAAGHDPPRLGIRTPGARRVPQPRVGPPGTESTGPGGDRPDRPRPDRERQFRPGLSARVGIAAVHLAAARGDLEALRAAAARLDVESVQAGDLPDMLARWCVVARAEALLGGGEPAAAVDCIDPAADRDGFAGAQERVVLARAHLALDQPQPALTVLEPLLAPTLLHRGQAVEARILTAVAAARLHTPPRPWTPSPTRSPSPNPRA